MEIQAAVPVLKSIQAAQTLKRKIPKLKKLRLLATVVKDVVRKIQKIQKTDLTTIIEITKIVEIVKITKIDLRIRKIIIKITIVTEITKIGTTKDQVPVQVIITTAAVVAVTKSLTKKTDLIEITKIIEDQDHQITDPPLTVISMTNQRKTNRGLPKLRLKLKKTTENQSKPVLEVCSALICLRKKLSKHQNHRLVAVQAVSNRQKLPFLPHQVL